MDGMMTGRKCTICNHPQGDAIDAAVIAGESYRHIASQFPGITYRALGRHAKNHLVATLAAARDAERVACGDDLLDQVADLQRQAQVVKDKALEAEDLKTALVGIRELVRIVTLLAKLRGELNTNPVVNVLVSPGWTAARTALMRALEPYPEARAAVVAALLEVEG